MTNPTASSGLISISAVAFNFPASSCGNSVVNIVARGAGPKLFVPATATIQLTFPQPFVTAAVTGPQVCLVASGFAPVGGISWSAVGHKILP